MTNWWWSPGEKSWTRPIVLVINSPPVDNNLKCISRTRVEWEILCTLFGSLKFQVLRMSWEIHDKQSINLWSRNTALCPRLIQYSWECQHLEHSRETNNVLLQPWLRRGSANDLVLLPVSVEEPTESIPQPFDAHSVVERPPTQAFVLPPQADSDRWPPTIDQASQDDLRTL